MACKEHSGHNHKHGANCGHTAVQHGDHVDYIHEGHLHHQHEDHVDEHALDQAADCTSGHKCSDHDEAHVHGAGCGHEAVPHGDHTDYIVNGHLHHSHGGHCDNHGKVQVKK